MESSEVGAQPPATAATSAATTSAISSKPQARLKPLTFSRKRKRKLALSPERSHRSGDMSRQWSLAGGRLVAFLIVALVACRSLGGLESASAKSADKSSGVTIDDHQQAFRRQSQFDSTESLKRAANAHTPTGGAANSTASKSDFARRRSKRSVGQQTSSADLTRVVSVAGQRVELTCPLASELLAVANSGAPQPDHTIIWRKDGQRVSQLNPRQKVNALNGSLVLAAGQPQLDEGGYECALVSLARESEPIKLHRFELRLLLAPRLAPFEFPAAAQVGMKVMLTCSALEGQQPISFVWLKDNKIIAAEAGRATGAEGAAKSGAAGGVPSLGQLHQQQLAEKLALSAAERQEYLVVGGGGGASGGNSIEEQSKTGERPASSSLLSDSSIRLRQSDDYSILTIERLELKHAGRYTCSAQNEAARASHSSQLAINAPPTLTLEPKDGDLVSGQSAVIDCAASGQPRPTISWLRARELAGSQWDYVPIYDSLRYSVLANGSLAIANATQREGGFYLCQARNGFGADAAKLIRITVHEPAKFSSKYKTMEVKMEERASLVCVASGELPLAIHWLDRDGNPIQKNDKRFIIEHEDALAAGTEAPLAANSTLSRLMIASAKRADSGHYTCQASNKFGTDKTITNLLVQDVPDKVTELKVTNVTAATISLRWQLAFTGNSPVTSYLVQYQSDDPLDDLLAPPPPPAATGQRSSPASASNLRELRPSAADANGELLAPPTVQPPSVASSLKAALEALGSSGASSSNESADEAIDRTLVELTVEQATTSLLVKDLTPFCVYRLRLAAVNKIGLGEFSDWIRAKTEEAPPSGSAQRISAAATGPNSVKVTWSPPDRRTWNGQLIGFNLVYRPIDSTFEHNKTVEWAAPSLQALVLDANKQAATSGNKTAEGKTAESANSKYALRQHLRQLLALQQQELVAHLTNLQRSTTYLVWIQAANARGLGPQSHAVSIKTLDDVPPSAPALRVQSASATSITIAWSMLSNFVSPANQYSLFYRRMPQLTNASASMTLNQRDLQPPMGSPATLDPGPFVERTVSSQQLMLAGNLFFGGDHEPPLEVNSNYMHPQAQHYQQFVYTLDQLECGSVYELYMTTRNSVGKSEPSSVVTTRTLGEPPLAPLNKNGLFTRIGTSEASLNLASWSTGGCPLTHITIRYKQTPTPTGPLAAASSAAPVAGSSGGTNTSYAISWPTTTSVPASLLASINKDQLPPPPTTKPNGHTPKIVDELATQSNPTNFLLKNLLPSTSYELEIVAHNSAGQTTAQYEFVTSNLNGTRGGYSRREGVFRIDHRGAAMDQPADTQLANGQLQSQLEQQANQFAGQTGSQLVPLILLLLCFVCLIISSTFCYYRLLDSWKRQRRSSMDDDGAGSRVGAAQVSPDSLRKSPLWRMNGHSTLRHKNHLSLADNETSGQESPPSLHHCARDPASSQHLLAAANPNFRHSGSFAQSVSMRDFNLMANPSGATNAATLNLKSMRDPTLKPLHEFTKAGTMRARLSTDPEQNPALGFGQNGVDVHTYGNMSRDPNVCSMYASACKQRADHYASNGQTMRPIYSAVQQQPDNSATIYSANNQQCNYQLNGNLQQETCWTNYANQAACGATNYAIPSSNYPPAQQPDSLINQNGDTLATSDTTNPYGASHYNQDPYGQQTSSSIDACIQQLISHQQHLGQSQDQQQQQPYAMIINGGAGLAASMQQQQQQQALNNDNYGATSKLISQLTGAASSTCGGQSVVDSSSGSSGIDVGTQLDCGSTITASTTNGTAGYNQQRTSLLPQ